MNRIVIYSLTAFIVCLFLIIFDLTRTITAERSWYGFMRVNKNVHFVYSWDEFMQNFRKMNTEDRLLIVAKCPINLDQKEIELNGQKRVMLSTDLGDSYQVITGGRFYVDPAKQSIKMYEHARLVLENVTFNIILATESVVTKYLYPRGYNDRFFIKVCDKNNNCQYLNEKEEKIINPNTGFMGLPVEANLNISFYGKRYSCKEFKWLIKEAYCDGKKIK